MVKKGDTYHTPYFQFSIQPGHRRSTIKARFPTHVHTDMLPTTHSFLRKHLPTVLKATCYNNDGLPFHQEVKATHMGHLFEHLILDLAVNQNHTKAPPTLRGETAWNWHKDPRGTFHITIALGRSHQSLLVRSARKAAILLEQLIQKNSPH